MADQLDDFLKEDLDEEPVEEEAQAEPEADEKPESETAENEEAPAAPEDEPKPDKEPETIAMSAFMGQKQELKETKAQLHALQQQNQPEKEEVDIFENPEKFKENVVSEAQQIALNSRFETSEMIMQDKHEDYDAKAEKFEELIKSDPSLYNQLINSRNPAKFLYDHVVKTEKMSKFDNIEDHEAAIRAEERAKVLAEIEAQGGGKPDIPPSMIGTRSSSAPNQDEQVDTLDSILNG